jgi:hypothetical protein
MCECECGWSGAECADELVQSVTAECEEWTSIDLIWIFGIAPALGFAIAAFVFIALVFLMFLWKI